jgi:RNA polymerase sigma-70 factor (ECF subfamily)
VIEVERIVRAYEPALRRLAAGYEADPAQREDLLQDMLLALWRALPRFRGDCSERTFVYRVAQNRALSHLARRRPAGEELEHAHGEADPRPGPEEMAALAQRREALRRALHGLPLPQRQMLLLALEDLPMREIAEVLGITENNAAVRLSRARAALRRALENR